MTRFSTLWKRVACPYRRRRSSHSKITNIIPSFWLQIHVLGQKVHLAIFLRWSLKPTLLYFTDSQGNQSMKAFKNLVAVACSRLDVVTKIFPRLARKSLKRIKCKFLRTIPRLDRQVFDKWMFVCSYKSPASYFKMAAGSVWKIATQNRGQQSRISKAKNRQDQRPRPIFPLLSRREEGGKRITHALSARLSLPCSRSKNGMDSPATPTEMANGFQKSNSVLLEKILFPPRKIDPGDHRSSWTETGRRHESMTLKIESVFSNVGVRISLNIPNSTAPFLERGKISWFRSPEWKVKMADLPWLRSGCRIGRLACGRSPSWWRS